MLFVDPRAGVTVKEDNTILFQFPFWGYENGTVDAKVCEVRVKRRLSKDQDRLKKDKERRSFEQRDSNKEILKSRIRFIKEVDAYLSI